MKISNELKRKHEILYNYVKDNWRGSLHEAEGALKHKFMDPAAVYRGQMWDWDSFFCAVGLIDVYEDTFEYAKGCVLNFVSYINEDGSIPYQIPVNMPKDFSKSALPMPYGHPRTADMDYNSMKPLLAQMALLAAKKAGNFEWLRGQVYESIKRHLAHWEKTQQKDNGLFVWRSHRGSGTDNHPAIYGRPLNSSAGVELNCFMYKEYLAAATLSEVLGYGEDADLYRAKAAELSDKIDALMWDEIDGLYYHLDTLSEKPAVATQHITWTVPLKFRCWTCFMPMFAGIAPKERVERMVREHLMNDKEFYSPYGLCTLAKNEPAFSTEETSNPSNWQGPIWIVSEYMMFKGLLNYGFYNEAAQVTDDILNTLCRDIEKNGLLHEYYNPYTGVSSITPGFKNWNALAALMVPELKNAIGKDQAHE